MSPDLCEGDKLRNLTGAARYICTAFGGLSVVVCILQLWSVTIGGWIMQEIPFLGLFVALIIPPVFFLFPATKRDSERIRWYDVSLFTVALAGGLFVFLFGTEAPAMGWDIAPPTAALVIGPLYLIVLLEACRRSIGVSYTAVLTLFILYLYFGHSLPGIFQSPRLSYSRIIGYTYLSTECVFGIGTQVYARLVIGFIVFAGALASTGAGNYMIRLGLALVGRYPGGAAKVAIVSSAMVGSISGSATANVLTTGIFTIPAMKKTGYSPEYAAGVEAAASTGGLLAPPVMGAVAFVMSDFLRIPYADIALAAVIPTILYYYSLMLQSHFHAKRYGFRGMLASEIPSITTTLKECWWLIVVMAVLLYVLFVWRLEEKAAFYALLPLMAWVLIDAGRKKGWTGIRWTLVGIFEEVARFVVRLAPIMVSVGIIIGTVTMTGVAQGFASAVTGMAGENIFLILLLAALASFVLGMGMTSVPCYIFLALTVAPPLVSLGLDRLAVHFFVMYWGIVSFITPPVALAAAVAAQLAEANFIKTGLRSLHLGICMLVVPFLFVYEPSLVGHGSAAQIIANLFLSLLGLAFIAAAIEGFFFAVGNLSIISRLLVGAGGTILLNPVWKIWDYETIFGILLAVGALSIQRVLGSRWTAFRAPLRPSESSNQNEEIPVNGINGN
jgi:TRAP transporter 4TM/12TM fusion protein